MGINLGKEGDYLEFKLCMECGQIQGKFPVSDEKVFEACNLKEEEPETLFKEEKTPVTYEPINDYGFEPSTPDNYIYPTFVVGKRLQKYCEVSKRTGEIVKEFEIKQGVPVELQRNAR